MNASTPSCLVAAQLGHHLVRITHDRGAGPGTGSTDAGPQRLLDEPVVVGVLAQLGLAPHAGRTAVERPRSDLLALLRVERGEQVTRRCTRLGLGLAHDDVAAEPDAQRTSVRRRTARHVGHQLCHGGLGVGPGQEHVRVLRGDASCRFGVPAEVHRGALATQGRDAGRVQLQVVELTVVVDRAPVEQLTQDRHDLGGAAVPGLGLERSARQVRGDDVDRETTVEHPVERGELSGQLRWPHLRAAHRCQQLHTATDLGRDTAGEHQGVDAELVARRQQDVVEPLVASGEHDVAAVLERAHQMRRRHPELFDVVVAQRGEPRELRRRRVGAGTGFGCGSSGRGPRHGRGSPVPA